MSFFGYFSAVVVVCCFVLGLTVFYYLFPSRGQHANPHGAAVTVATARAASAPVVTARARGCPHDDAPTLVIFDPELPGSLALVRPYLDRADYRSAAVRTLVARKETEGSRSLSFAA
ncbi:hypothetical protein [Actinokineospora iranica]|uniref:Uncharacterized protein n=1 Tax=Actinokineospora iranica TaxID=1271860 RepID=A0A1G6YY82_9PSEU|nr:hypothetical protein [Actinokineospora iranica]SDD94526.1 hypothetical protein SAMN05216174_1242 [Actinokineospora iranica]